LVANLGTILAARGLHVTILDADFGLANLDIVLNLNPRKNLGHLLRGDAEPFEVVLEAAPGLKVIPGATGIEALADLGEDERGKLLTALAPLTAGSDLLLIDTSAGIGRNVVSLCEAATEVVLVTNPEPTSLTDAYGLIKVLLGRKPDAVIRVVVNSVSGGEEARAVHRKLDQVVSRFLGRRIEYLGHIERDECVGRATQRQTPFVTAYPRSAASRCVAVLANAVAGEIGLAARSERAGGGFWRRLLAIGGGA
jgi:flagellar biosynthesis protein FlhG